MRITKTTIAFLASCMAVAPMATAFAAGEIANEQQGAFTGRSGASANGCPTADWHITQLPGDKLGGVVFWTDNSGISQATGTFTPDGKFTITLVSASGKGPVGTVTGARTATGLTATMAGEGCNQIKVNMKFDQQLQDNGRGSFPKRLANAAETTHVRSAAFTLCVRRARSLLGCCCAQLLICRWAPRAGRLIKLGGKLPVNLLVGVYYNALRPQFAGTWQLRTQIAVIF